MCASTPHNDQAQADLSSRRSARIRAVAILNRLRAVSESAGFACSALLLVATVIHSPSLQGQRIWDDRYLTQDNPMIKSPVLILETFRHYLFLDSFSPHYRPVQNISMMWDYFFWNTNEFGFHLTNVLLHGASGILLYFLLRRVLPRLISRRWRLDHPHDATPGARWISYSSFGIALLWVAHPVHSAAVDYISGRADSLAFIFSAGSWLLFEIAQSKPSRSSRILFNALALLGCLLGLLSREIALVWVGLFLIYLFFLRHDARWLRITAALACFGVILIYAGLRQLPGHRPISASQPGVPAATRVVLMSRALGDYARLMVFPSNLHMERTVFNPRDWRSNDAWRENPATEYLSILGLLTAGVLIISSAIPGRGQSARLFGAIWFLAAYLPISNIVQLNATVAEHWLYLPSVGFFIFLFGCCFELPLRCHKFILAGVSLAAVALGAQSFIRSGDWANEETFYRRTLAAGSQSARAAVNLGQIFLARGDYPQAEHLFRLVLDANPNYPIAQNNLADLYFREGKTREAERLFGQIEKNSIHTREDYPRTWIGAFNLASIRHRAKDDAGAIAILEKARSLYPHVWEIIALESEILRRTNQVSTAERLVRDFSEQNWWHHGAALALGRLYAQEGNSSEAETALRRASLLDVHDAEALDLLASVKIRQNDFQEALRAQRRAIARQPDEPSQYLMLSDILDRMGRQSEARAALDHATRLRALVQNAPAQSL
jgi:Flp pilus assembly protein TadD